MAILFCVGCFNNWTRSKNSRLFWNEPKNKMTIYPPTDTHAFGTVNDIYSMQVRGLCVDGDMAILFFVCFKKPAVFTRKNCATFFKIEEEKGAPYLF